VIIALDLETCCNVEGCVNFGKSICREDHSLSPWHGKITTMSVARLDERTGEVTGSRVVHTRPEMEKLLKLALQCNGIVGHNAKFDILWLRVHGFNFPLENWVGDSQLQASVLTEKIPDEWLADYEAERKTQGSHHRRAGKTSLKSLAPYFLGAPRFWESADHSDDTYARLDAEYTARLWYLLNEKLKERGEHEFYQDWLLPKVKMLIEAEERGLELDMGLMSTMEGELHQKAAALKAKLDEMWQDANDHWKELQESAIATRYEAMKHKNSLWQKRRQTAMSRVKPIDLDSPKQLLWLLRDYRGYDCQVTEWCPKKREEVTKDTTGAEVLERLAEEGHEDAKVLLEWREANKVLSSYFPAYRALSVGTLDGRREIYPVYNPTKIERDDGRTKGTRTGRLSSERPNAQQIPEALRRLFKAREGYSLIGYDQAAIEARLIALYTEDPTLYELVASGASIHDRNVQVFFGVDTPLPEVKHVHLKERSAAKNVGFALFYHAGAGRIRSALSEKGFHFSKEHCRRLLRDFRDAYSTAFEFAKGVVSHMEAGHVVKNLCGRPLRIENPEDAYMKAFNTLVQSSASDLLLEGAHRALTEMRAKGIDAHPVLFVHDFVGFEVADAHVAEADAIIRRCLTDFDLPTQYGPIRLEVEGGVSKRWEK
jgi:DNA polymerase-1